MSTVAPKPYLLRHEDRRLFKRCRRAWDLGATTRGNLVPRRSSRTHDLDRALRDALAIYYFPGMWTWNRAIVYPTVLEAFARSMSEQRVACERALTEAEDAAWRRDHDLGEAMLRNYFTWAPTVDRFTPAWVGVEFGRGIPDPARPGHEVLTADGREVRVRDRIEVLVKDEEDVPWLLYHRFVDSDEGWADLHELELDERGLFQGWAWEHDYLGWTIAGAVYHELRRGAPEHGVPAEPGELPARSMPPWNPLTSVERRARPRVPLRVPEGSGPRLDQEETHWFRRTRILRSREEVAAACAQVIDELGEMTDPQLRVYPNPSPESCGGCAFREPCAAMYRGEDAGALLEAGYHPRSDDAATWRLGSRGMLGRGSLPWKPGR